MARGKFRNEGARKVAGKVREHFAGTPDIVSIDDTVTETAPKMLLHVLQSKAALMGVAPHDIVDAIGMALTGQDVASLHDENAKYAPPLRIGLPAERRSQIDEVLKLKVRARDGALVPLSELVQVIPAQRDHPIYHKDLLPVVYVFGDMAGDLDSPLYGMFGINAKTGGMELEQGGTLESYFFKQPSDPYAGYSLKPLSPALRRLEHHVSGPWPSFPYPTAEKRTFSFLLHTQVRA